MALSELVPLALFWFLGNKRDTERSAPAPAPRRRVRPPSAAAPAPVPVAPTPTRGVQWPHTPPQGAKLPPTIPWAPMPTTSRTMPVRLATTPVRAERQTAEAALIAREKQPLRRDYWRPAQRPTPGEVEHAVALLRSWSPNCISFYGPRTWEGRKQYRCATHGTKRAIEVYEPAPPFQGGGGAAAAPAYSGPPVLRNGSKGPSVARWQAIAGVKADGKFGPQTEAATKQWQAAHGLTADGIVGPKTWAAAGGY